MTTIHATLEEIDEWLGADDLIRIEIILRDGWIHIHAPDDAEPYWRVVAMDACEADGMEANIDRVPRVYIEGMSAFVAWSVGRMEAAVAFMAADVLDVRIYRCGWRSTRASRQRTRTRTIS